MDSRVFLFGSGIVQVAALVKLISLLVSFLRSDKCVLQSALIQCWRTAQSQFLSCKTSDTRSELELDMKRCAWTRIVWRAVVVLALIRLTTRQVRLLRSGRTDFSEGLDRSGSESDLVILIMATLGLSIALFPCLINPRSQDACYVLTTFCLSAGYLIPENVDVADMIGYTSVGVFMYAVLAKRTWCAALCTAINLLTAIRISQTQAEAPPAAFAAETLPFIYFLSFLGIVGVRRLMRENVLLKVDLQKQTVELGAVSSLLTACYDAVFEVDDSLRLTNDSIQLSSMLLYAPRSHGLAGTPLQDFFSENDRARISEQFLRSKNENLPVVAFNADLMDSDVNRVKVELIFAQFKNLVEEQCFLVAVREIQDEVGAQASVVSADLGDQELQDNATSDLSVVYDAYTLELYVMTPSMEQLWKHHLGAAMPESILQLASDASRADLHKQLQSIGNTFASQPAKDLKVAFNLLGRYEVTGVVNIEEDQMLSSSVGTLTLTSTTLVFNVKSDGSCNQDREARSSRRLSRSSRSSRGSRVTSQDSRSSRSRGSPAASEHSGVISQLRQKPIQL